MRISVVGIGAMGREIALHLMKAGHQVTVWNRSPGPVRELVQHGAREAVSVREALGAEVVLSTLFDDAAVEAVLLDPELLRSAAPGLIHACMSTISPELSERLARTHAEHGISYVAAPMFGRPEAAAKAALNIVMAGEDAVLERLEPVFAALGRSWRMGTRPVHANLAKLSGNFMIGCAIETMAEAAALLGAHGADARAFLTFMSETLFASPIYKSYGATIGSGQEPVTSIGLSLPLKDVGLTLSAGHGAGVRIPLASLLWDALLQAKAQGLEKKDWSVALAEVARLRTEQSTGPAR